MKLYTREQMIEAFNYGRNLEGFDWIGDMIDSLTPIELPTDAEVTDMGLFDYASKHGEHCDPAGYSDKQIERWHGFYDGATWVINKIKGGEDAV